MKVGPLAVSPMGLGTWAWGNQLLWGYDEEMDEELQQVFNLAISKGINLFDTADSYGTGKLNGRSEILLGKFIREYPGSQSLLLTLSQALGQTTGGGYTASTHLIESSVKDKVCIQDKVWMCLSRNLQ